MLSVGRARRGVDDLRRLWPQRNSLPQLPVAVVIAAVFLVLFRSAMFVFETPLFFDSDQAVFGLMAKHIAEGRAFPLFMYGQNYMLGVEAWLAAPLFLLFGASAVALKLPLLAINLVVGGLLVWLLQRDVGLRPLAALTASLFFLLAPAGTTAQLLQANGGNLEPFLYVLLLWLTRRRPVWFGLLLGVGVLQREFTIYALAALIVVEVANGSWRNWRDWRWSFAAFRVAAEVWLVIRVLRPIASGAGPGTTGRDLAAPISNLVEVGRRICFDLHTVPTGVHGLITDHWVQLFGTQVVRAYTYGLESKAVQGMWGIGFLLSAVVLLMIVRLAMNVRSSAGAWKRCGFCIYLILVGAMSAGVYVVGRCGGPSPLRYDLLSILGAVGLAAWFLAVEPSRWCRSLVMTAIIVWAAVSAVGHARIWSEYVPHPPIAAKTLIIRHLDARGIKYAVSDYWIAYYVTFLTNERIIVETDEYPRIAAYGELIAQHRKEAIRISRSRCGNTQPVIEGVYFCPLE